MTDYQELIDQLEDCSSNAEGAETLCAQAANAIRELVANRGVWPNIIAPAKYDDAHPSWEDPRLPNFQKIWAKARECGYAVGIHGSLKRDVDLIAVPWVYPAQDPETLIQGLCNTLKARVVGEIEPKPHGRVACSIQIDGWYKVIDLSIVPRLPVMPLHAAGKQYLPIEPLAEESR